MFRTVENSNRHSLGGPLLVHCQTEIRLGYSFGMFPFGHASAIPASCSYKRRHKFASKPKGAIFLITRDFLDNTLKSLWQNGYCRFASSKDGQTCPKNLRKSLCCGVEKQKAFQ